MNKKKNSLVEGIILSKLKHPNIIECYDFHYENSKIIISIKYEERRDLLNKIENQKNNYFKEEE